MNRFYLFIMKHAYSLYRSRALFLEKNELYGSLTSFFVGSSQNYGSKMWLLAGKTQIELMIIKK